MEFSQDEKERIASMTDASATVRYLMTLPEEDMRIAMRNMSVSAKHQLLDEICTAVGNMARDFVQNSDQIWNDHHESKNNQGIEPEKKLVQ